uniref:SAM domain-containing protein n=1 Tax=Schistocephalus solidus TaxID=70667 RepID=A0A183SAA4_SCHSO
LCINLKQAYIAGFIGTNQVRDGLSTATPVCITQITKESGQEFEFTENHYILARARTTRTLRYLEAACIRREKLNLRKQLDHVVNLQLSWRPSAIIPFKCLELMPTVANSELLSFFVPFVNSHNPVEFTKESQLEPIIFSSEWMSRLLPALTVGRREAQALAAFHFVAAITAMGNSLQKLCPDTKEVCGLVSPALSLLGIPIPKCLSMQVCRWTVEEVVFWMSRIGFGNLVDKVRNLNIDGDLLLTMTENELRDDLGLSSSLTRRRFIRELVRLKCKSDYSPIDRTQLADFLSAVSERLANASGASASYSSTRDSILWNIDFTQYTYNLLSAGVTRPLIARLSDKDLLEACRIENSIHRQQILEASKNKDVLPGECFFGGTISAPSGKPSVRSFCE